MHTHTIIILLFLILGSNFALAQQIPENAHKNAYGNRWDCNRGYYKSGGSCHQVIIPKNGKLNFLGNRWDCEKGFKKSSNRCIPMTPEDIQEEKIRQKALIEEIRRREALGVSGDDCETEYRTYAEVCVEITGEGLDCSKSFTGEYYSGCDVSIEYELTTDYQGGAYLDVQVSCEVEIEYEGRNTYSTRSDSDSNDEYHSLFAYDRDTDTMHFSFSFSSYDEVYRAEIGSTECEIDSVDLY